MDKVLTTTEGLFPDLKLYKRGKVRDLYDLGDMLLIVATDRISAFDYVLPNGIPCKGKVLTGLSVYWFEYTKKQADIDNHLISVDVADFPEEVRKYGEILSGRSMLVKKAERLDLECVVRGYLAGSAWRDYQERGEICGVKLPPGLREADKLSEPIFTPATKAESGHDENITIAEAEETIGKLLVDIMKEQSVILYTIAAEKALSSGLILADTKFEFGLYDGSVLVIDEMLTPDSSRYWSKESYEPGRAQLSFDKQYVRDYLLSINWDKQPPVPQLPDEVIQKTTEKYLEAYKLIVGQLLHA